MTDKHGTTGRLAALLVTLALIAGCAQNPPGEDISDPIEPFNRGVYDFNDTMDRQILGPIAAGYVDITPSPVRRGITNFFDNLSYPGVFLNNLLQGKVEQATRDTIRFVVNSTLGIGGLLDPASAMGLESHNEDFGQTLGAWGAGSGPFLTLPLLGPSNARDVTRYPVAYYTNVLTYVAVDSATLGGLTALMVVNTRANLDRAVRIREQAALDPYAFTRSAYEQNRRNLIRDGARSQEDEDPYGGFFDETEDDGEDPYGDFFDEMEEEDEGPQPGE